ncbi:fatty-acyl-CoA synthase [Myxococcaceae bacterium]|nr:fatty-acyl-CoA synthase [Myxococcaceae bacterium]
MAKRDESILAELVAARAETKPDLDVLTFERGDDPPEVRTYADLLRNANRIGAALVRHGLERGDRFGLMLRNHPEYVETMIAASLTGTVFVPIDPRTRGEKLVHFLRHSGSKGLVAADYCLPAFLEVRSSLPDLRFVLGLDTGEEPGAPTVTSVAGVAPLREVLAKDVPPVEGRIAGPADPLQILYTSGTTGDPKGVVFQNARFGAFAMLGRILGYRPDERPYTGLSLTHGNAQAVTLGPSLHMGLRAVLSRRFTKSRLWDICRTHGCTTFSLLGGMATAIYAEPRRPNDRENPVRMVISAGMPRAIWKDFEERFGVQVFEWYGAVEGGLALKPIGQGPIGSFGKPAPGLEMKIVDEEGNECPAHGVGEIVSRPAGGKASVEYFKNEEASRAKAAGGWLRSGDMGHRDEEGWFFFDYRKGGGIRHDGEFVQPDKVEKVIADQPGVTDVFVYGVPAASGAPGEKDVVAAIVPTDPTGFDPGTIFAACRRGLDPASVPQYLQVVDEIPKTASEKPQERFLLERFAPDAPGVHRRPAAR